MTNNKSGEVAEQQYATTAAEHLYDVTPNPRYLESLRDTGYDNYQAISDIVDNSVDAIVRMENNVNPFIKVNTKFFDKGRGRITVIDNGIGMTKPTLIEALKLGSETNKERDIELGFFGVGLNAATVSMGRGFKVITKHADDVCLCGIFDLDKAIKEQSWKFVSIEEADDEHKKLFKKLTNDSPTGTIVEIYNLDRISNHNKSVFDESLLKTIGRIYRYFISEESKDGGISFYVNEKKVRKIDPMGRELKGTKLLNDKQPDQKYQFVVNGETIDIIVRYYYVDSEIETVYPSEKLTARYNGFYVLRNERQIMDSERLDFVGIDKAGGHHSNFRAELLFDGKFDHIFKTNVMKNRIIMPQQLTDTMQPDVSNYVKFSKETRQKNEPPQEAVSDDVMKDVDSIVNKKNKSLTTPTLTRDKKGNLIKKEELVVDLPPKINGDKKPRKKEENPRKPKSRYKIDVDFYNGTEQGSFFIPRHMGSGKYLIRINSDHGFYKEFETLTRQGREFIINILHSFALGAHSEIYTADLDTIDELINTWSSFLRRDLKNN